MQSPYRSLARSLDRGSCDSLSTHGKGAQEIGEPAMIVVDTCFSKKRRPRESADIWPGTKLTQRDYAHDSYIHMYII